MFKDKRGYRKSDSKMGSKLPPDMGRQGSQASKKKGKRESSRRNRRTAKQKIQKEW